MQRSSIEYVSVETASFVRAIRETIERITEHTQSLENIGIAAQDAAGDGSWMEQPSVLCLRASKLRALTSHGLLVLQEIAVQTGRLELLAYFRAIGEVGGDRS